MPGDGEWGLRSVDNSSFLLSFPPHTVPHSSMGSLPQSFTKCSNVGLSHDLQFSRNSFIMGPFYGVKSFRSRVFPRGSPMGHRPCLCSSAWVSPPARRLLQCGLCMGCSFLQDTSIYSAGCRDTTFFTVVLPQEAEKLLLWWLEHLLPLLT